jgi:hypothetical protein
MNKIISIILAIMSFKSSAAEPEKMKYYDDGY